MKLKVNGIKNRVKDYVVEFEPFTIGDYVYKGAVVGSSKREYVKLEITLYAENQDGANRRITFALLDNNNIITLKRSKTFGVELSYKLTTIVQQSIKIVSNYRKKLKKMEKEDSGEEEATVEKDVKKEVVKKDTKKKEVKDKEVTEDVPEEEQCLVTNCHRKAIKPDGNPLFCDHHTKVRN